MYFPKPFAQSCHNKLLSFLAALGWICFSTLGCNRPIALPSMQVIAGRTMGTTYSIKFFPSAKVNDLRQVSRAVEAELEQVNSQMSTYLTTSELSRFNSQASLDWFPVSRQTAEVVQLSLQLTEQTGGAFDVTVGPLVNLWGFGPAARPQQAPSAELISTTLQWVGADKLSARLEPPALKKSHPNLQVDLSAIAKGHGVDRVAEVLERSNVTSYFVEIGGEVRTKGRKPSREEWQVGIERPTPDQRSVERVLALTDRALATSGNYRNYYELDGRKYSHTINPKTGYPVEDPIASASVIADNCALADGIATGMMSAGYEAGLALAEKHSWCVLLIKPKSDQSSSQEGFETVESTSFKAKFGL